MKENLNFMEREMCACKPLFGGGLDVRVNPLFWGLDSMDGRWGAGFIIRGDVNESVESMEMGYGM